MPMLITRDELKSALGIPASNTAVNSELDRVILAASQAVINHTGRDFGAADVAATRSYEYDGSGYLDIDDATVISAVTYTWMSAVYPIQADTWRAQPYGEAVFWYLILPKIFLGGSPEMGFTANHDVLAREGRWGSWLPTIVNVTGTFGWPIVPDDVKQAVIWTSAAFRDQPGLYVTESIEGYSRSTNQRTVPLAVPERARDILAYYEKLHV